MALNYLDCQHLPSKPYPKESPISHGLVLLQQATKYSLLTSLQVCKSLYLLNRSLQSHGAVLGRQALCFPCPCKGKVCFSCCDSYLQCINVQQPKMVCSGSMPRNPKLPLFYWSEIGIIGIFARQISAGWVGEAWNKGKGKKEAQEHKENQTGLAEAQIKSSQWS